MKCQKPKFGQMKLMKTQKRKKSMIRKLLGLRLVSAIKSKDSVGK